MSYVVRGAGGVGKACDGTYAPCGTHNDRPIYKQEGGDAIIYFDGCVCTPTAQTLAPRS